MIDLNKLLTILKQDEKYRLIRLLADDLDKPAYFGDNQAHRYARIALKTEFQFVSKAVCFIMKITEDQLLSTDRHKKFVWARNILVKILKDNGYSYTAIAEKMKRNHAAIIHAYQQMDYAVKNDWDEAEEYYRVLNLISDYLTDKDI